MLIKIHVRRAADREYSYFHLYMCVCFSLFVYLFMCVTPPGQTKNDKDTHSPRPHLRTVFFLFFQKSDPEGRQPWKTAVSRGFSAYLLDCLVIYFILFIIGIVICINTYKSRLLCANKNDPLFLKGRFFVRILCPYVHSCIACGH